MNSLLTPPSFVERLLESDGPVWHHWDRNLPALLEQLKIVARTDVARNDRLRSKRILWLLDRLTPPSDAAVFEPYLGDPRGLYAWGRRLPPPRRSELTRITLPPKEAGFRRIRGFQAATLAWCDACPDEQLTTLLKWSDCWDPAFVDDMCWSTCPEQEFSRRCLCIETRRSELLKSLRSAVAQHPNEHRLACHPTHNLYLSFRLLLEQTAKENPGAPSEPSANQEWVSCLERTLASPPFAELGRIARDMPLGSGHEYLAKSLWIWRHGRDQWKQLHVASLGLNERQRYERLSEIVPPDELLAWDEEFLGQPYDHGEFEAYCHWLAPKYAEVLSTHFNHPDPDWRACAYQNWLTKAPEPMLQLHWRHADNLPGWQAKLLDRRLFAPEVIRPAAIVYDTQAVEADLRLQDPFNHRSF